MGGGYHKQISFTDFATSSTTVLDFLRVGDVVEVTGRIFKSSTYGWITSSVKIPEIFRPKINAHFSFSTSTPAIGAIGYIDINGHFTIFVNNIAIEYGAINVTYFAKDITYTEV